jgi:hypothetical protein
MGINHWNLTASPTTGHCGIRYLSIARCDQYHVFNEIQVFETTTGVNLATAAGTTTSQTTTVAKSTL